MEIFIRFTIFLLVLQIKRKEQKYLQKDESNFSDFFHPFFPIPFFSVMVIRRTCIIRLVDSFFSNNMMFDAIILMTDFE